MSDQYSVMSQEELLTVVAERDRRIAELEAECLLHWQACDTAWRANEIQAKRIAELEGDLDSAEEYICKLKAELGA